MAEALWIGGPPGSGKTTIADRLARQHGLRRYSADTQTWTHRDRALAAGSNDAERFEQLAPVERWAASTDELLAMSLHTARGPMVIEDVALLSSATLVVAEGTPVPGSIVASGLADATNCVWLLPTTGFQDERLSERSTPSGQARLHRRLREVISADASHHGVPVEIIDGSRDLDEVTAAVARRFDVRLRSGPTARDTTERRSLLRAANVALVEQVHGYFARPWADGSADDVERRFVCECGSVDCREVVVTTVGAARRRLVAPGHP